METDQVRVWLIGFVMAILNERDEDFQALPFTIKMEEAGLLLNKVQKTMWYVDVRRGVVGP